MVHSGTHKLKFLKNKYFIYLIITSKQHQKKNEKKDGVCET